MVVNGGVEAERWASAVHVSGDSVAERPRRSWGLVARGATIEAGTPEFRFDLVEKLEVWSDDAAQIYRQTVAAQWIPRQPFPETRRSSSPPISKAPSW